MLYQSILNSIPESVKLVAVSKYRTVTEIMSVYNAGQRIFAENRVQALLERHAALPKDIEWHLIGHLQSNKVKHIVDKVSLIHSADSIKILDVINKEGAKIQKPVNVLLQIKIAQEEEKFGFNFDDLHANLLERAHESWDYIRICGVMGMGTLTSDKSQTRKEFQTLASYFSRLKEGFFGSDPNFKDISMGMSGDFELAIEEGATMVRIGSALFENS